MSEAPTKPCGAYNGEVLNCINSQECFAAPESPICSDVTDVNYSWKLNAKVFPPIEYIGNKVGLKQKDHCELFNHGAWTAENIEWLLTFFYQNWDSSNSTTLPLGSFVRPMDSIGSCVEGLYCDHANKKCKRKHVNPEFVCNSSNQCLSQLCGVQGVTKPIDGEILFTGNCIDDGYIAYNQLKGNRTFNVLQNSANDNNNNDNNNDDDNNSSSRNSSGSMAVVIIIIVILFASMAIYGYARRMFKKRDSNNDDSRFLRREIDPETGEIVTVNTLSGRVRRGASILLNRAGSLNRSNSIRTLPPYSVVDEYQPPASNGIINSITQYFFPPGELPPPYDSVTENVNSNNNNNNNNSTHDVTLDEVREGVTIEGNSNNDNDNDNNNNNNDNDNSIPPSRRSSLATTSRREVDDPRELNTISVISIDSEIDKEGGGGGGGGGEGEEGSDTTGLVDKEIREEGGGGSDTADLADNPT